MVFYFFVRHCCQIKFSRRQNAAVLVTCVSVNDNVTYDFELVFKIVFYFSIRYRRERIIALMKKQDRFDTCYKGCANSFTVVFIVDIVSSSSNYFRYEACVLVGLFCWQEEPFYSI